MATHGGAADSYYQDGAQQPQQQYQMQSSPNYQQQPPTYDTRPKYGNDGPATNYDGKQTFDQTFKVEGPKWNDLWAGILVRSIDSLGV